MRMTYQRQIILDILKKDQKPKSAEMIMQLVSDPKLNLSTVYRTLDAFFYEGILSKSTIDHVNYYYVTNHDHHHYIICTSCKKMVPIECHLDAFTQEIALKHQFKITHHDMTVYGICRECQQHMIKK
ncbi:MAG: Fur family transcriptional regulator [Acholeplasmataceae bacterium]|jgi:Fur family ferric uptake transcriptional regulator|nr:Fur family transcriptional regulator [Acholeplasmataceae bacterium]